MMQGQERKMEWLKGNLKNLNKTGLNVLIQDAQLRIMSHSTDGDSIGDYIKYQQSIIELAKKELNGRLESGR